MGAVSLVGGKGKRRSEIGWEVREEGIEGLEVEEKRRGKRRRRRE